jgi:hypothetical protein
LIQEQSGTPVDLIGGEGGAAALVIGLHLEEALDRVSLRVIVDHRMMVRAQKEEVVIAVPVGGGLVGVVRGTVRACRLDVTDLPDDALAMDDFDRAFGISAAIS